MFNFIWRLVEDWSPGDSLSVLRSCSAGVTGEDQYISNFGEGTCAVKSKVPTGHQGHMPLLMVFVLSRSEKMQETVFITFSPKNI